MLLQVHPSERDSNYIILFYCVHFICSFSGLRLLSNLRLLFIALLTWFLIVSFRTLSFTLYLHIFFMRLSCTVMYWSVLSSSEKRGDRWLISALQNNNHILHYRLTSASVPNDCVQSKPFFKWSNTELLSLFTVVLWQYTSFVLIVIEMCFLCYLLPVWP